MDRRRRKLGARDDMTESAVEVSSIEDTSPQRNRPSPSRKEQYPRATPIAPFGLRATHDNADADVGSAEAIISPTTATTINRFID